MSAVSYAEIQNAYNNLYASVRKYIWDFATVAALADLEIAIYKTCQDVPDIRIKLARLKSMLTEVMYQDEDMANKVKYLEDLIYEDTIYVKLNKVEEVVPSEDQ